MYELYDQNEKMEFDVKCLLYEMNFKNTYCSIHAHMRHMKNTCWGSTETCNISLCVLYNLLHMHTLFSLQPLQCRRRKAFHTVSKNKDIDFKKLLKSADPFFKIWLRVLTTVLSIIWKSIMLTKSSFESERWESCTEWGLLCLSPRM